MALLLDTFTRPDQAGLGTAGSGQVWLWNNPENPSPHAIVNNVAVGTSGVSVSESGLVNGDGTIKLRARVLNFTGITGVASLVFRSNALASSYIAFEMNYPGNRYMLTVHAGSTTRLAQIFTSPPPVGTWMELKVVLSGSNIKAYADGTLLLDVTSDLLTTNNHVGFAANDSCEFDDIEVLGAPVASGSILAAEIDYFGNGGAADDRRLRLTLWDGVTTTVVQRTLLEATGWTTFYGYDSPMAVASTDTPGEFWVYLHMTRVDASFNISERRQIAFRVTVSGTTMTFGPTTVLLEGLDLYLGQEGSRATPAITVTGDKYLVGHAIRVAANGSRQRSLLSFALQPDGTVTTPFTSELALGAYTTGSARLNFDPVFTTDSYVESVETLSASAVMLAGSLQRDEGGIAKQRTWACRVDVAIDGSMAPGSVVLGLHQSDPITVAGGSFPQRRDRAFPRAIRNSGRALFVNMLTWDSGDPHFNTEVGLETVVADLATGTTGVEQLLVVVQTGAQVAAEPNLTMEGGYSSSSTRPSDLVDGTVAICYLRALGYNAALFDYTVELVTRHFTLTGLSLAASGDPFVVGSKPEYEWNEQPYALFHVTAHGLTAVRPTNALAPFPGAARTLTTGAASTSGPDATMGDWTVWDEGGAGMAFSPLLSVVEPPPPLPVGTATFVRRVNWDL